MDEAAGDDELMALAAAGDQNGVPDPQWPGTTVGCSGLSIG